MSDTTVWICESWAYDGGGVHLVAATEAVAQEWLAHKHREEREFSERANEHTRERGRGEMRVVSDIRPRDDGGAEFACPCDTYLIRPVEPATAFRS